MTALASYLQARSHGGRWLLRIDDLDAPRCPPGMAARILRQLEAHALDWDEAPRYQSAHVEHYRTALAALRSQGRLYACTCSRADLRAHSLPGPDGLVYDGACRDRKRERGSLRLRVGSGPLCFDDHWQGRQCRDLATEVGDVVLRRADGQIAYQLACVVDERAQAITEVVRGVDLLGSTFQQRCVQDALGLTPPAYRHLPVLLDARGRKLSKQNHAPAIVEGMASANLHAALMLLGQAPPPGAQELAPAAILRWATLEWDAAKVPRSAQIEGGIAYNAVQQSLPESP